MKGILGRKICMSQVFDKTSKIIPITIIEIKPNKILQIKTKLKDGYNSIKLGYEKKINKFFFIKEIRFFNKKLNFKINNYIKIEEIFKIGDYIDVFGKTKGKGFQGVIKKNNQKRGPMTHGSRFHRRAGSMGAIAPNRVFKNKKLPGHMGNKNIVIQNLKIIYIENNLLFVSGSIPGPKKSFIVIKSSIKKNIE